MRGPLAGHDVCHLLSGVSFKREPWQLLKNEKNFGAWKVPTPAAPSTFEGNGKVYIQAGASNLAQACATAQSEHAKAAPRIIRDIILL